MIELKFLKELMLIKQVDRKNVIFVTIVISQIIVLSLNQISVIGAMISINLSNIAILNIKCSGCRCIISLISKNEAIKLMQNADMKKVEHG